MKLLLTATLLFAAAMSAPAMATGSPDRELYSASTTGELTIDPQGRVVDVRIDPKNLGGPAIASYEARARAWTFEPVVQDGRAVAAKAHFALALLAVREAGVEDAQLGVHSLRFYEPQGDKPPTEAQRVRMQSFTDHPPRYPSMALRAGVGAKVVVWAEIGADGGVVALATDELSVMHASIREKDLARWGELFSSSAEDAIAKWRFPGEEGTIVQVPVNFNPGNDDLTRWRRTWPVVVDRPGWLLDATTRARVIALDASGERPSDRIRMLAAVDG